MAERPMRSENDGGLSEPANPIPEESLDCGCGQLPCPKLAKYATRKLFVGLICWIGIVQASAQAYYGLTSSTIARKYQINPGTLEWISIITDGVFPFILALPVAYWGDRIHRAAWTGALVLLQSAGYILMIIPHLSHSSTRIIEEIGNTTHLSIYADDSPELCFTMGLARLSINEDDSYIMSISIIIVVQLLNCLGNIAYLSFAISYLDDNTRKRHVGIMISFIIAVKFIGLFFGYLLAWGCLRIDADDLSLSIISYREQVGAWWFGWPFLAIGLAIGGVPMSWMPRRLSSEVIEQAATSILDQVGRISPISESTVSNETKYGDPVFFKSLIRLVTNKILMCNILASVFCTVALINFANYEDIYLESRFYIPRPTGLFLGFNDPLLSRIIYTLLRPIVIGLIIIISGIVIVKFRPRAKWIVGYNIIVCIIAAIIMITVALLSCHKPPIAPINHDGSISLLTYCNRNCRCSADANFLPICDSKNSRTFYSPCHAGCTSIDNTSDVKKFIGCNCIEEITGIPGNNEAIQGPCGSSTCQYGWIVFEISAIITYSLIASGAVGSIIIGLRSIYIQDKALAIGLWITIDSIFVYAFGQMIYWQLTDFTCIQRGRSSSQCHLHDSDSFGSYLAYLTALLLIIGVAFELLIFIFCKSLRLYRDVDFNPIGVIANPPQEIPLMNSEADQREETSSDNLNFNLQITDSTSTNAIAPSVNAENNQTNADNDESESVDTKEVYATIRKINGPIQRRSMDPDNIHKSIRKPNVNESNYTIADLDFTDDDDEVNNSRNSRAPISLSTISYRRLGMKSDSESNVSSIINDNNFVKAHKENETHQQNPNSSTTIYKTVVAVSRTDNGGEFTNLTKKSNVYGEINQRPRTGDFNEIGLPIVDYSWTSMNSRSIGSVLSRANLENGHRYESPINHDRIQRTLSPTENTSSGFSSSGSDLHNTTAKQSDKIFVEDKSNRANNSPRATAL